MIEDALQWLERTPIAAAVRGGAWLFPAIEAAHIVGIGALFGSIALLDLRLIGLSRSVPLAALARHALPVAYAGFALLAATGFLMFASDATKLASNPAFQIKLLLILAGGLNALVFNLGPLPRLAAAPPGSLPPVGARVLAGFSIALWVAVIVCGRLIAYV